mmetsp:Transcript_13035/g.31143  ORF Transcript_13035/g.31143 Transcript_13035/m.31143 type:complete len:611 (+) Transcript_13035:224-2056(+)
MGCASTKASTKDTVATASQDNSPVRMQMDTEQAESQPKGKGQKPHISIEDVADPAESDGSSKGNATRAMSMSTSASTPASRRFTDQISRSNYLHSRIRRHEDVLSHYKVEGETVLGTGISGAVRVATHRESGRKYALKSLSTENVSPKKAAMLFNEVSIYLQLDHPNIAKLIEVYEDDNAVHLIMELCTGKELYDRLATRRKYSERDAANVTRQMLKAINYCHKHKICHRDLKLENWVYANTSPDAALKLIDFGFSRIFNPGVPMTAMHGTVYYVSPEVMDGAYNEVCDIWSVGVIVYMLLSGSPPFNGSHDHEILAKIRRGVFHFNGPRWEGISDDAKDFIRFLLRRRASERPTAEQALQHPWITQVRAPYEDVAIDVAVLQNMRKFSLANHMKRSALALVALSMNSAEVDDLEKIFKKLDKDGNGTITLNELQDVLMHRLAIPEAEAQRIFQAMDQSGDHELHYCEFLAATLQAKFVLQEHVIREAFQKFDVDHTGYISVDNLRTVLGETYNGTKIEEIIKGCDFRGTGVIEYDEFLTALTSDDVLTFNLDLDNEDGANQDNPDGFAVIKQMSRNVFDLGDSFKPSPPRGGLHSDLGEIQEDATPMQE